MCVASIYSDEKYHQLQKLHSNYLSFFWELSLFYCEKNIKLKMYMKINGRLFKRTHGTLHIFLGKLGQVGVEI